MKVIAQTVLVTALVIGPMADAEEPAKVPDEHKEACSRGGGCLVMTRVALERMVQDITKAAYADARAAADAACRRSL